MSLSDPGAKILELLTKGHSPIEILNSDAFPNRRIAEKVFFEITEFLESTAKQPIEATKGFTMQASLELFKKLNEIGDYAGALRALETYWKIAKESTEKEAF